MYKQEQIKSLEDTKKQVEKELKKVNPNIDYNVFKSTFNVNLNTILGYHDRESRYFFLDDYDEKNFKN